MTCYFKARDECEALAQLHADHERINGKDAPLAMGVGNNMSYAFYTHRRRGEIVFWVKGLPPYIKDNNADYPMFVYRYG